MNWFWWDATEKACFKGYVMLFYFFYLSLQNKSTDTELGGIQLEGEVKLLCLDARRTQRQWLTLSFFAVGLWVWARDRNSLYRHCVCDCWNYSTVERFVHSHQGKPRQQKHTHSGKKNTWEGSFSPQKNLAWVSAVNDIPFRRGKSRSFTKMSRDHTYKTCCYLTINLNLQVLKGYDVLWSKNNHIVTWDFSFTSNPADQISLENSVTSITVPPKLIGYPIMCVDAFPVKLEHCLWPFLDRNEIFSPQG